MRKTTVYITIAIVLLALYFFNKTKTEMINTPKPTINPGSNDLAAAFAEIKKNFGPEFAKKIEQLYRLETAHFTSKQFLEGNSPGMVATKSTYPFGWASLDEYNREKGIDGRKYGIGREFIVRNKSYRYVKFPDFKTAVNFVAWFIRTKRGGIVEKWNSLDPATAAKYLQTLSTIRTQYT